MLIREDFSHATLGNVTTARVLIVVPGTWWRDQPVWRIAYDFDRKPMQSLQAAFGIEPRLFEWPGGNTRRYREHAAATLAGKLREHCRDTEINLVGFSHGGNVAVLATQYLGREIDRLITISTPVLKRYQPGPM
jgi:pimeloyl-ACP methyl ester carboxylesterase